MRPRLFFRQRPSPARLCLLLLVATLCWNEWISLEWSALFWDTNREGVDTDSLRILIVADPQIIGYINEREPFAGIARWDADRYLRRGFARAFRATKPNLVLFLGDLFDEGVVMSRAHFKLTLARFHSIFPMPSSLQKIYVPGDNDVGGEVEPVDSELVSRFSREFSSNFNPGDLSFGNVNFVHLNAFDGTTSFLSKSSKADITFLISHVPIIRVYGSLQKTVQKLNPALILSSHDHTAELYKQQRGSPSFERSSIGEQRIKTHISNSGPVVEFQSPTCSYRMGVSSMGYGFLTLVREKSDVLVYRAEYSVLWLPGRFPQLLLYGIVAAIFIVYLLKVAVVTYASKRSLRLRLPLRK